MEEGSNPFMGHGKGVIAKADPTWTLKTCPTVHFPQLVCNHYGCLKEMVPFLWHHIGDLKTFPNGEKRQERKQ